MYVGDSGRGAAGGAPGGGGGGAGRLLGRLDPRALTLAHPGLGEGVAAALGCPALGEVAEERLDPGHALQPVEQLQVGQEVCIKEELVLMQGQGL